jgi:GTP-binding protein
LLFILYDDEGLFEWEQLWEQFSILRHELEEYSPELLNKPFLIAINKIDLAIEQEQVEKALRAFKEKNYDVFPISAREKIDLNPLLDAAAESLRVLNKEEEEDHPPRPFSPFDTI